MKAIISKKCLKCSSTLIIEDKKEIESITEETTLTNGIVVTNNHFVIICPVCKTKNILWTEEL